MLPAGFPNPTLARILTTGGINRADRRRDQATGQPPRPGRPANTRLGRDGRLRPVHGTNQPITAIHLAGRRRLTKLAPAA